MKKFVKLCVILLVGCAFTVYARTLNQIIKISHHKGVNLKVSSDKSGDIQLGNVIFYFSQKPIVNFVPEREKGGKTVKKVFIFPYAEIKDKKWVQKINDERLNAYKLNIEKINKPIKGVKFTFTYNPQEVVFDYKFFDSMSDCKGVVFNFYNKNIVNKLKYLDDRVLRIVCNDIICFDLMKNTFFRREL
ncbi:hypothetical protein ACFLYU_01305 [Candidatus Dependentiae bacterium]